MATAFANKRFFFGAAVFALVFAVAAALLLVSNRSADEAEASHGFIYATTPRDDVAFDMVGLNPRAGPIGANEQCVSVTDSVPGAGADFSFDVVYDGIPAGKDLSGYNYFIDAKPGHDISALIVVDATHAGEPPGTTILDDNGTGFVAVAGSLDGVSIEDPAFAGKFAVADADFGAANANPPYTNGVLNRFHINVSGAAPGLYPMVFETVQAFDATGAVEIFDAGDQDSDATDDDADGLTDDDHLIDAFDGHGVIAVNVPCPLGADLKNVSFSGVIPILPLDLNGDTNANDVPVSTSVPVLVNEVIHSNGPETPAVANIKIDCTPPQSILVANTPGGSCSFHVTANLYAAPYTHTQAAGDCVGGPLSPAIPDLKVTKNNVVIATNPAVGCVFDVPWPDVLDVHKQVVVQQSVNLNLQETFDLHCYEPSTHTWKFDKALTSADQFVPDPNLNNNNGTFNKTVDCIAQSDLKVSQAVSITDPTPLTPIISGDTFDQDGDTLKDEDGPGNCDAAGTNDDDGDTLIDEDGGDCYIVNVDKTIHNNGPYGPAPSLLIPTVLVTAPDGVPLPCTATPLATNDPLFNILPVSVVQPTVDEDYVVECPALGYLVDDDGDSPDGRNKIDEDCPGDGDNDGDTRDGEDCTVSIEAVTVINVIVPADPHIVDPDLAPPCNPAAYPTANFFACADNVDADTVVVQDVRPFNPTFTTNQDEVNPDTGASPAPSIDCLITLPCKMLFSYALPGGNPLAGVTLIVGSPEFTITRPTRYSGVGDIVATATIDPGVGACTTPFPAAVHLVNGALPFTGGLNEGFLVAATGGVYTPKPMLPGQLPDDITNAAATAPPSDLDALVDEDPPDFLGIGGISTDQDGDTIMDEDDVTSIAIPNSWSKHLNASVLAVTASKPTANLIMRKVGFVVVVGTVVPINVLVFYDPNGRAPGVPGYLETVVTGDLDSDGDFIVSFADPDDDNDGILDFLDPNDDNDALADPLEIFQCTPLSVSLIEYGLSATEPAFGAAGLGGEPIIVCNVINTFPGHVFPASFLRLDLGTSVTRTHLQTCSGNNDVSQELAKDENVGNGAAVGYRVDNDGDTQFDEDPAGGGDQDGDSSVDEDGAGDPNGLPVGVNVGVEVDVTINNGNVPSALAEELSIVSQDPCTAVWDVGSLGGDGTQVNVALQPLIEVGPTNVSILNWTEQGDTPPQMDAFESVTVTAKYMVKCTAASTQTLQIESEVQSTPPLPDDQPLNNEDQNNPQITANKTDVDGDGRPNATDNCPFRANANQADSDGDGIGDACDHDDDNDGIDDAVDACPGLAEDPDGEADGDGCPETDMSINVVKDNPISVDVSVNKNFTVTATATNGNYGLYGGHGVIFFEMLKSNVTDPNDKCVASWIPQPGDLMATDTVVEVFDGVPNQTVFISQLQRIQGPLPPFNSINKVRDYTLHCNARSDHKIFLEEGIAPTAPIQDPNVNNNVHKQYIDVEAYDRADVKMLSHDIHQVTAAGNTVADGNGDSTVDCNNPADTCETFTVIVKKVLHNNGPAAASVSITASANVPNDCTATLTNPGSNPYTVGPLAVSVQTVVFETWSVKCRAASDHAFTFNNAATVTGLHVRDHVPGNSSDSSTANVEVFGTTSVVVTNVNITHPPTGTVSQSQDISVGKNIVNNGPFAVQPTITQTMNATGANANDCSVSFHVTAQLLNQIVGGGQGLTIKKGATTVNPPTPAGWQSSDSVVSTLGGSITVIFKINLNAHQAKIISEKWDKHCFAPSTHTFNLATSVTDTGNTPHVSYADSSRNDPFSQDILATADVKISSWFFLDDVTQLDADSWFREVPLSPASIDDQDIHSKEKLHNNGPFGPVATTVSIVATPLPGCNVSYEVSGNESAILINAVPVGAVNPGDIVGPVSNPNVLTVKMPANLPVSVDVWLTEKFGLGVDNHTTKQCIVNLDKNALAGDPHISDANGASAHRDFTVCLDTDEDGVADACAQNGEQDNCTDDPNPGQLDSDGDGLGDACDNTRAHDLVIKYCIKVGPAPVNLSDNQGHYLWTLCEIGNFSDHDEAVTVSLTLETAPTGCSVVTTRLLPGQATILLDGQWIDNDGDTRINEDGFPADGLDQDGDSLADEDPPDGEQKIILFRTRFECHSPAQAQLWTMSLSMCVDHGNHAVGADDDGDTVADEDPLNGIDNDGDSSVDEDPPNDGDPPPTCHEQDEQVIIDQP
jgi:hypothetical protein